MQYTQQIQVLQDTVTRLQLENAALEAAWSTLQLSISFGHFSLFDTPLPGENPMIP